ncbi:MAG: RNA polymerase sigma-70 factor [Bacteroidota bacterium]
MAQSEAELFLLASTGNEAAFECFFKTYYQSLLRYAYVMLRDEVMAEEMVQQVFYKLWEKREKLTIHISGKAFLYKAVYNECLNYLKHEKHKKAYEQYGSAMKNEEKASDPMVLSELQTRLQKAMNELPEQCRKIFYMNRIEGLKYREVAEELGLSIKTVEAQVSKALKILRRKLADYLPVLLSLLFHQRWFK